MSDEIPADSEITSVPGWCPPDVEAAALECLEDWFAFDKPVIARRIARAILAERERCAKIADEHAKESWGMTEEEHAAQTIASAIRSSHE